MREAVFCSIVRGNCKKLEQKDTAMKEKLTRQTISYTDLPMRNFDKFNVGDMVIVSQKVKESSDDNKERIQNFQGTVIAITNRGVSSMFTVRKIGAHSVPVERIFPYFAPFIHEVKVVSRGVVRRAKLYYLRKRVGKQAIVEKKTGKAGVFQDVSQSENYSQK